MAEKHDHSNSLFSTGHAPTGADAQDHEFFGFDSQQDLIDSYKRDNADHAKAPREAGAGTVAQADKYADSNKGRK